jgi:hypothetical protein
VSARSNAAASGNTETGPARAVPGDASGQAADQSTPSICAKICSSVEWRTLMAPAGQPAAQQPQALQTALMMRLTRFCSSISMAPYGQSEKQVPHPAHSFSWTSE